LIHPLSLLFIQNFNSSDMKRIFLLAVTATLLTGTFAFTGGSKKASKQADCTHCTKQNCTGAKCAECCSNGKCVKG